MTGYPFPRDGSNESATSELDLLAIQERFIDDVMRGESPRLSAYLLRYPQYAAELAAFAVAFLDDPQSAPEIALRSASMPDDALSPGIQAALRQIAGSTDTPAAAPPRARRMVAETPVEYQAGAGLAMLRVRGGLSREEVARRADLSPEIIAWLERVALADPERAKAVVARLAEALEASSEEVMRALTSAKGTREGVPWETVKAHILGDRSLTQDQGRRWHLRLRDHA